MWVGKRGDNEGRQSSTIREVVSQAPRSRRANLRSLGNGYHIVHRGNEAVGRLWRADSATEAHLASSTGFVRRAQCDAARSS